MKLVDRNLLEGLLHVHRKMQDPKFWDLDGICAHIRVYLEENYDCFPCSAIHTVNQLTGGDDYPIDHPDELDNRRAYLTASPEEMWDRENSLYARNRWDWLEQKIREQRKK